ncbi:hypothetical protein [Sulfuricurvum sp.]|uniref:hypothetical protein n=1 Tax=Sulfuricurvum sp. TaxID=2025608 RepID=UPI003BB5B35B
MDKNTLSVISEFAKRMRIMVIDADSSRLNLYKNVLEPLFVEVYLSKEPREAYKKWHTDQDRYEIVIISVSEDDFGHLELFKAIRKKSYEQKIIIALASNDYNDLRDIIARGIDGVISGPSDEISIVSVFQRLLRDISDRKLLHSYITQLSIMAKDNADLRVRARNQPAQSSESVEAKSDSLPQDDTPSETTPASPSLIDKYSVRTTFKNTSMAKAVREIDVFSLERIDKFRENIYSYQQQLIDLDIADTQTTKTVIIKTTDGLLKIIEVINDLNLFPVTVQAALHMSTFIRDIDPAIFENLEKKNLIIDIIVALFDDLDKWIETVFINQDLEFVNYFDASFANTCLELESAFSTESPLNDEDDALEFF